MILYKTIEGDSVLEMSDDYNGHAVKFKIKNILKSLHFKIVFVLNRYEIIQKKQKWQ